MSEVIFKGKLVSNVHKYTVVACVIVFGLAAGVSALNHDFMGVLPWLCCIYYCVTSYRDNLNSRKLFSIAEWANTTSAYYTYLFRDATIALSSYGKLDKASQALLDKAALTVGSPSEESLALFEEYNYTLPTFTGNDDEM